MKRPFAFAGFSSAIVLLVLNITAMEIAVVLAAASAVLFIVSLLVRNLRQGRVVPIVFGSALFSCLVFILVSVAAVIPQQELAKQKNAVPVSFYIIDMPEKCDYGYVYEIKTQQIMLDGAPQNIKLDLYSKDRINADAYDNINASIRFQLSGENAMASYGDYPEGKYLVGFLTGKYMVDKACNKPLGYYIISSKERIISNLDSLFRENSGLPIALVTGNKSRLPDDVLKNFKICGISHIIAVSGLHIMLVCTVLYYALRKAGLSKYIVSIITAFILIYYMGIAGFSKSVIRAGIMLAVLIISNLFDKKADSLNSLGIAVFIICLNPFSVCDAGAMLTVCATLGIVRLYPELNGLVKFKSKMLNYVSSSFAFTFSVMLCVLPVMWLFFGSVSLLVFVVNIFIIIPAEFALALSLICGIVGKAAVIGTVLRFITLIFVKFITGVTELLADNFSFLLIDISSDYYALAISAVLSFTGACLIIAKGINPKAALSFTLLAFLLASFASVYDVNTSVKMYVTPDKSIIVSNRDCAVIIDADDKSDYYYVKSRLNVNSPHYILFVDCDYDSKLLSELADGNADFVSNKDFSVDLCNAVSVKYDGGVICVTAYDDEITIHNGYFLANGFKFGRDNKEMLLFSFRDNREFQLRRLSDG